MQKSLLLGCGNDRTKKVWLGDQKEWTGKLVTLDMNPHCDADVHWDLEKMPLPFEDEEFDELAAYDVLEHQGRQGDWRGWFDEMAEYWRILKPQGLFGIIVPIGQDALADPGHTRFFHQNHFGFLVREFYVKNVDKGTQFTDYRWYIERYWELLHLQQHENHHLSVILRKAV